MREVWTFFYGSFMNPAVLAKADVHPAEVRAAELSGWDLQIAPFATLVPAVGRSVFGVLARLTHVDLEKLYAQDSFGIGKYLPEAVLVSDLEGRIVPALTYIAEENEGGAPSAEYIAKIIAVARELRFPEWYVKRIESFLTAGTDV
jgi:cation transport regulator ChaC